MSLTSLGFYAQKDALAEHLFIGPGHEVQDLRFVLLVITNI